MSGAVRFILGGIVGLLGILGLSGAAEAETGQLYYVGLAIFAAAIAYDFHLIKAAFDAAERRNAS